MGRSQYLFAIGVVLLPLLLSPILSPGLFSGFGKNVNLLHLKLLFQSVYQHVSGEVATEVEEEWNHFYHLGGNGPWVKKTNAQFGTWDKEGQPPEGCEVDQVHIVCHTRPVNIYHTLTRFFSLPDTLSEIRPPMLADVCPYPSPLTPFANPPPRSSRSPLSPPVHHPGWLPILPQQQ